MFFNQSSTSMFRPEKEQMMTSASPSQLSSPFSSNLYSQPPVSSMASLSLQQRGMSNPAYQRNNPGHVTPTSIGPNFPLSMQQPQSSPNSSLFPMGPYNQLKRSLISSHANTSTTMSSTSMSRFGGSQIGDSLGLSNHNKMNHQGQAIWNSKYDNQPSLDLSEFPTLGNRSAPVNPMPSVRNYVGMVSKPAQEPAPEFQIQQEDFPALPGAQNPTTSSASENTQKTPTSSPGIPSYEAALSKDGMKMNDKGANPQRRGIQTLPDGRVANVPPGMVTDQFGMVGLLAFIRYQSETDQSMSPLVPGFDLTTLGLSLNSQENLYSTFQSPWAEAPCRPQDIDYHVPQEYLTNICIRDKLAPIKLNRYGEDLLFFLFYMNGGDVLQLAAAAELYSRDWRYHKEERVWITRVPGMEPQVKTNLFERGTYYFFDVQNCRKVPKEFRLEYDKLEDRPMLPQTNLQTHNQPPVMVPIIP